MPGIKINIDEPRYNQDYFIGRLRHFAKITNPLNILVGKNELEEAKRLINTYKHGGSLPENITEEDLWKAKVLYDSAYHPDTGQMMTLPGRMSAQVPGNLFFNWGMLTFYKTAPAVIFWQWFNQSFNALVNYTNRSGDLAVGNKQLFVSYILATAGAVGTALGLKQALKQSPPVFSRFVPFVAVASAHCVNIPIMRAQELELGTPIYDENGNKVGYSKQAAKNGIIKVVISRILMQVPSLLMTPVLLDYLEQKGTLQKYPWVSTPVTLGFAGVCLLLATPMCCAIFKQKAQISFEDLEDELQEKISKKYTTPPKYYYFNKGL